MPQRPLEGTEITLLGAGVHEKLGGGARIGGLINILKDNGAKINLISFIPYSDKFRIEHKQIDEQICSSMIEFPAHWRRIYKEICVFWFNFYHTLRYSRSSDVVWASCSAVLSNLPSMLAAKLGRTPLIYDLLDIEVRVSEGLFQKAIAHSDAVFVCSHYLGEKAANCGNKNIYYMPCFVNLDRFRVDNKAREELRKEWGVNKDEIVIGYSGVLWVGEGVAVLLKAIKMLLEKRDDVKVAVMGVNVPTNVMDDPAKIAKELGIERNVLVIPPVTHERVPKFLSACDILCSPKIDNDVNRATIAIKLVEYMAMGLPTVSSKIGQVSQIITPNYNGYLTIPGDADNLSKTLSEIIEDLPEARVIGKRGRDRIAEEFSDDVISRNLVKSILEITNKIK